MDLKRIYEYRFKGIDANKKNIVWREVAEYIYKLTDMPKVVLDPAGGMCEFINNIRAEEKWTIDINEAFVKQYAAGNVRVVVGDNMLSDLPKEYFDLVFISNFLEHLSSQQQVAEFLKKITSAVKLGGYVAIMGPNFKYAWREYFDFADHTVCLSDLGAAEHLVGAGFTIRSITPRFLPLSFRGRLPVNRFLVKSYLKLPFVWRIFGKQFLIVGEKV